jgi:hypothetical protein
MPSYDSSLFNVDPYYDDFSEDKKFLRLMFRPGYGVQARELTQLQTILQNQIERFGSHVFDEGSIVLDGQISENRVKYAKVALGAAVDPTDFIGTVATVSGKAKARIVHAEDILDDSNDEYSVLFFEYMDGGTTFTAGDVISATASNGSGITASVTGPALGKIVGDGIVVSVDRGVRFVEGYFVLNTAQSIGAYTLTGSTGSFVRLYESPTTSIGFTVEKSFVTATDDTSLNDPAFGFYNYAAPGSDRFKIDLTLSQRDFVPTDTSSVDNFSRVGFVEFMRLDDGDIVKVEKYPDYAVLEDTLARRTYDESGNYTVTPFELNLKGPTAVSGTSVLKAELSSGKAYVFGYEFETQSKTKLNLPCARGSAHERTVTRDFNRSVGPYTKVIFSSITDSFGVTSDLSKHPLVILSTGTSGAAYAPIGTARIRWVEPYGAPIYNLSLYDISLTANEFSDVTRIFMGGVTAAAKHLFTITGSAGLEREDQGNLLWQVPEGAGVTAFNEANYAVTTYTKQVSGSLPYTFTVNAYTGLQFPITTSPVTLPNADVTVFDNDGRVVGGTAARGINETELSITVSSNTSSGKTLHVVATQDVSQTPMFSRTKTDTTVSLTLTGQWGSALTGDFRGTTSDTLYLNGYADIIEVLSLTGGKGSLTAQNLLSYFTFDSGQRDSHYDWSRLTLNAGVTGVTGPYLATFRHYAHDSNRGPFSVKSYPDYEDIPAYTSRTTGTVYQLRDCIDFRPVRDTDGKIKATPWIPTNTSANDDDFTYTHHLPRTDKIVLTRDRRFAIVSGIPSINGDIPADDPNAMSLYTVRMNPYTFDSDDVSVRYVENKRYTMRDIGDLEKRIEAVEYYTTLSLLEQEAKAKKVLDTLGDEMPKKGILVDQFKGHTVADNADPMFAASIDYERNELRPPFTPRSYGLTSASTTNVTGLTSDGVYLLSFTESPEISHLLSSDSTAINPFSVINYLGTLSISPAADTWFDTTKQPQVRVNVEGENDNWEQNANYGFGTRYNDWEAMWFGRENANEKNSKPNLVRNKLLTAKTEGLSVSSINASIVPEAMKKVVANRTIARDVLPIAREKTLTLTAKGLKPSTAYRVYCDDVDVTAYCTGASQYTDAKGEATVYFPFNTPQIGSYSEQNFLVGRHSVRITDGTSIDNQAAWTMLAEAAYAVEGAYDSVTEDGILSTRLPDTRRKSVKSEKVISNLSEILTSAGEIRGYSDPLAQTVYIDPVRYPRGVFLKSVDLYFSAKDTLTTIPVTVQVRPTISGYPHPSKVLPFGSSTLYSNSIITATLISSGSGDKTNFAFTTPVYLLPGREYAICVSTNSPNFSVFMGKIGSSVLRASEEDPKINVAKQPFMRSLFKASNGGKLTKTDNETLAMRLNLCRFTSSGTVAFRNDAASGSSSLNANEFRLNAAAFAPEGSTISYSASIATSPNTTYSQLVPNRNIIPSDGYLSLVSSTSVGGFGTVTATLSASSDGYVSPVFDLHRSSIVAISNTVNNNTNLTRGNAAYNGELEPSNSLAATAYRTAARYITKKVTLESGVEADNVTVTMSLCNPKKGNSNAASIQVFVRPIPIGENDSDFVDYVQLTTTDTAISTSDTDFREVSYTNIGSTTLDKFTTFSVKIVMYGDTNGSAIPRIRNLRIIAT